MDLIILEKIGQQATYDLWINKAPDNFVYCSNLPLKARTLSIHEDGFYLGDDPFIPKQEYIIYDNTVITSLKDVLDPKNYKIDNCILWKEFDLEKKELRKKYIAIPLYLRHVIKAITNIYPIDAYLAAHYERQLLNIAINITSEEEDILNALNLKQNFDLTGIKNVDDFLRFQRKLYLTYQDE